MRTETIVFYTLAMVMCGIAIILTACKRATYGALLSSMTVLILVVSLSLTSPGCGSGAAGDEEIVVDPALLPQPPTPAPAPSAPPRMTRMNWNPQVHTRSAVAEVTNNAYVGPACPPPPTQIPAPGNKLILPLQMEGQCNKVDSTQGDAPACGNGFKIVPNMPPMPGLAQNPVSPGTPGEVVWRLPEYPVDQPSREETIAAVVSDLPTCCQQTPKEIIRNQGLYGIKGNLSCDLLKRSAVSDHGFLEPLAARNAFLAYNSYDQLHAKDQFLIPVNKKQPE